MKIIFAGTTEFGIPTLEKIKGEHEIILVITQLDKPSGRKKELLPSPIKIWAEKNNIPLSQPERITDQRSQITDHSPDLLLVAAYGQIIPQEILDIPKFKSINIHGSILPKYRGATPIQTAIAAGDKTTGITLIQMDAKMDHGPIIAHRTILIEDGENFSALYQKLSLLSADLIAETLPKWFEGKITPQPQDESRASYTTFLSFKDAKLDWTNKATDLQNKIRAYNPEPGTWTTFSGKFVKILEAHILPHNKIELPGKIYIHENNLAVKCSEGSLLIKKLQPEGKKIITGIDFLNGLKNIENKMFV